MNTVLFRHILTQEEIHSVIGGVACRYAHIIRVGVFGSYARGEQTIKSDIDIIYAEEQNADGAIYDILNFTDEIITVFDYHYNIKADCVSYHALFQQANNAEREAFKSNVLNDVMWVYEKMGGMEIMG